MALLLNFFNNFESYVCKILLTSFVVLLLLQIFGRILLGHIFPWTEELATYMFVWFVFFGASFAAKMGAHNRVTFQFKSLSKRTVHYIEAIADLFWLFFNVYFVYLAIDFVFFKMNKFWKSQTLGVEMKYFYMILPIAFTLMSIRIIQVNYDKLVRNIDIKDPDHVEVEQIIFEGEQPDSEKK